MGVLGVGADAEHPGAERAELPQRAIELDQLGGAHEGEVERPEEDGVPAALEVAGVDGAELGAGVGGDAGGEGEIGEARAEAEEARGRGGHEDKVPAVRGVINQPAAASSPACAAQQVALPVGVCGCAFSSRAW